MKYSKQLMLRALPSWREHYLDYKSLKKLIKQLAEERKGGLTEPEALKRFQVGLTAEAAKVDAWYEAQELEYQLELEGLDGKSIVTMTDEDQEAWIENMDKLILGLENLLDFSSANNTAFKKILKKFDKHMESNHSRELWTSVASYRFAKSQMEEALLERAQQAWRKRVPLASLEPTEPLPTIKPSDVPTVTCLDLPALPGGTISRLWLAISEDGLGNVTKVPLIVAKGIRSGPVVGLTAALHGNELNGIPLIHRVFREIDCQELYGVLVACPVANAPGYLRMQRGFSDGSDLNRLMPGKANGTGAQVYAHNLMERLIKHVDYLLDLHTASRGRINSLYARADMLNPRTRKMATLQNPQIVVHNSAPDGSLRGAAMNLGIPAITVEMGDPSRFQKRFVKSALLGVNNILCHLKMMPHEVDLPEYEPVICSRSYWLFADKGGVLTVIPEINTWVRKGEPIAYLHSLFGGLVDTYYAPDDGIVVGKSVDPVCER